MSAEERWFPSHLREIGKAECLELLGGHHVGRVAYCDALGPVVLPVNYLLDHGTVLFQISPHSTLAQHLKSGPASFQIDDYDDHNQSGGASWSAETPPTSTTKTFQTPMIGLSRGRRVSARSMSG